MASLIGTISLEVFGTGATPCWSLKLFFEDSDAGWGSTLGPSGKGARTGPDAQRSASRSTCARVRSSSRRSSGTQSASSRRGRRRAQPVLPAPCSGTPSLICENGNAEFSRVMGPTPSEPPAVSQAQSRRSAHLKSVLLRIIWHPPVLVASRRERMIVLRISRKRSAACGVLRRALATNPERAASRGPGVRQKTSCARERSADRHVLSNCVGRLPGARARARRCPVLGIQRTAFQKEVVVDRLMHVPPTSARPSRAGAATILRHARLAQGPGFAHDFGSQLLACAHSLAQLSCYAQAARSASPPEGRTPPTSGGADGGRPGGAGSGRPWRRRLSRRR